MSSFSDEIYHHSPIWLQQIAVTTWGAQWYLRRFTPKFHEYVREFHKRDYWSMDQFHEYQTSQLTKLLDIAWNSPYYHNAFITAGLTRDMGPWEALKHIPLLNKETVRTQPQSLLTQPFVPGGTEVFKSSGTTGTPTEIYYTSDFHALQMAASEARNLNIGGVNYRDRRVMFGVRKVCHFNQDHPPFWRYSWMENMAYCSIYHLSPRFLASYIEFFRRFRPAVVMGYPSALYTVARYALDHHDFPAPAKMIVSTSETVTQEIREAVETAWQCKLYDRYGAVEGCLFVGQCEQGHYHISPELGIIEILDTNGLPCEPGVLGEVVCTGLQNTLQPLIRYRLGDAARWSENQHCGCGRHTPMIEGIEGRIEDICYTSDGRQMLRFDPVFKGVENIKQAQIVQEDINLFKIYVVPANDFGEKEIKRLTQNLHAHVGDITVIVETTTEIRRSSSGKYRAVICNLSNKQKEVLRHIK